ncbi:ankyrin repeat domain-containing protein [Roseovarius aestuarii]|uniref:Ankyrin repeats (3 copies) n=1 Tax=Roseovarius aestuarii TaxID=475083 RepID=A0A1X7BWS4_9RHOB|nr:ankyrin repeat domain-containing protein [Roseovarius aestuarii]SMC14073.1 Ankyrin repeats (3 copies) [Roseovarius aestuarii]
MDFSDPISMIKKGISDLIKNRQESHEAHLDFLARFEKSAAWEGEDWTYWDFLSAPEELAEVKSRCLTYQEAKRHCDDWMAKNEASKSALLREIETGPPEGIVERIREMVSDGENPNGSSLLKDTPLEFARYRGTEDVFDLLIELGADGEKAGFSKLHHAVRYGSLQDAEPLFDSFDPLWSHFGARSVLCEAVLAGKGDIISALLDHVSSEGCLDHEEVATCFGIAAGSGDPDLVRPFLHHGLKRDIALDSTLESYDCQDCSRLFRALRTKERVPVFCPKIINLTTHGRPATELFDRVNICNKHCY